MIAQTKLQENLSDCPPPVPGQVTENQEIRGVNRDDGNCYSPLICVEGVSAASANAPIPFHTAENIIQAAAFAGFLGYPLEYHLTIHWPDDDAKNHEFLLRKIAEWQRYNFGQPVFVWAAYASVRRRRTSTVMAI